MPSAYSFLGAHGAGQAREREKKSDAMRSQGSNERERWARSAGGKQEDGERQREGDRARG
jgi:hypothetical protein